jgi:parallel beta-helix repeat protein
LEIRTVFNSSSNRGRRSSDIRFPWKGARGIPLRRSRARLHLESLEDRTAPAIFTVTNTLDDGSAGSLRWAINQANADSDPASTINFNIAAAGEQTISVGSSNVYPGEELPAITHPVTIDGFSQPGSHANDEPDLSTGDDAVRLITIDGRQATAPGGALLLIAAGNSTIKGLTIQNQLYGIHLTTIGHDSIQGVYAIDNNVSLFIDGVSDNTIGGTSAAALNVLGAATPLAIYGGGNNMVQGNYIGFDPTGMHPDEGFIAVDIRDSSNNTIGGADAGAGNVIVASFNDVYVLGGVGGPASNNVIQGNFLGTNPAGTAAIHDASDVENGVYTYGLATGTSIISNVIAQDVYCVAGTDTLIQSNWIGTDTTGTRALVNGSIYGAIYASNDVTIKDNIIKFNALGIDVSGASGVIEGNTIASNIGPDRFSGYSGGIVINGGPSGSSTSQLTIEGNTINNSGPAYSVNFESTLTSPIVITGGGADTLNVYGSTDPNLSNYIVKDGNAQTITWGSAPNQVTESIAYSGIEAINIYGGAGPNFLTDPGAQTTIYGGPGANTITITATTGTGVVINGGGGSNTYVVDLGNLAGPVVINNANAAATNNLVVNGAAGNNTIAAEGNQVTSGTQTLTDSAPLANLTVNGGSGNNTITVSTLSVPVQSLTLNGGPANDTISVSSSVTAPTTITAGSGGTDTLQGGGGTNTLVGSTGSGTTTFVDNGGTNTLVGGTGDNVFVPGSGHTTFTTPPASVAPIVFADTYNGTVNGVLNVAAAGVLANDLSANGRAITAVLASGPSHGTLTLNADGSFRYTPAAGFVGSDSFTYQAKGSDGALSAIAVVGLRVQYNFGGFLSPISLNRAFKQGSTIPIKWQLTDAAGHAVSSLSAVASLTVTMGSTTYTLFNGGTNTSYYTSGAAAFRNDGSQYVFNWSTKGFALGTYTLTATLADGTTHSSMLVLSTTGAAASLVIDGVSSTGLAGGALLAGDLTLYVDNSNGELTGDEQARVLDAVAGIETLVAPYGTNIYVVDDSVGDSANIVLAMAGASVVGGQAEGELGCTTDTGLITIIDGWSWYAGGDSSQIGAQQYDFQTVVTHELGHALGLGHSADTSSVMFAELAAGGVKRQLVQADLNVSDTDPGPGSLHAATDPGFSVIASSPAIASKMAVTSVLNLAGPNPGPRNAYGLAMGSVSAAPTRFVGPSGCTQPLALPTIQSGGGEGYTDSNLESSGPAATKLPAIPNSDLQDRAVPDKELSYQHASGWRRLCTACFEEHFAGLQQEHVPTDVGGADASGHFDSSPAFLATLVTLGGYAWSSPDIGHHGGRRSRAEQRLTYRLP